METPEAWRPRVRREQPLIARLHLATTRLADADRERISAIIEYYQDKAFSYCDAVSFAVMERLNIQEAIAFEDHFRQYGQLIIL